MRQIFTGVKNTAEYLMACGLAVVFAIYCSGRVGYFILFALILGPLISLGLTAAAAKTAKAEAKISSGICQKSGTFFIDLDIQKPFSYFPFPDLSFECEASNTVKLTGINRTKDSYRLQFTGVYAGGGDITIRKFEFSDYLGLVNFAMKNVGEISFEAAVIPKVREIPGDSPLLRTVIESAGTYQDTEETLDESTGSFGGFPGYEHREYAPGDPVKRINYKLSARRDELFVRLDEKQVLGNVEIKIDPMVPADVSDSRIAPWWEGRLEESLGLCELLLARQFTVSLTYFRDKDWITKELRKVGDAAVLCEELAPCRCHRTEKEG